MLAAPHLARLIPRLTPTPLVLALVLLPLSASAECFKDTDCDGPQLCYQEKCVESATTAACTGDGGCDSGEVCHDGWCKSPDVHCDDDSGSCSVTDSFVECSCDGGISSGGDGMGTGGGGTPTDEALYAKCQSELATTCGGGGGTPGDSVTCDNAAGACTVGQSGFSCACTDGSAFGGGGTPGGGGPPKSEEELLGECHELLNECDGGGTGPVPTPGVKCEGEDGSVCVVEPGWYTCECADGGGDGGGTGGSPDGLPPTTDELLAQCAAHLESDCGTDPGGSGEGTTDGGTDPGGAEGTDDTDPGGEGGTSGDGSEPDGGSMGSTDGGTGADGDDSSTDGGDGSADGGDAAGTDGAGGTDGGAEEGSDGASGGDTAAGDGGGTAAESDGGGSGATPATPAGNTDSSSCASGSGPVGGSLALVGLLLFGLLARRLRPGLQPARAQDR